MSVIHLIIQKEDFYVPKNVLNQSRYFRNLLEIQENDIEIENISPLIFRNLIALLTSDINIQKEVAILYDFLDIEGRLYFINQYHCSMENCDKILLNGGFCVFHKCIHDGCQLKKMHKKNYCHIHACSKRNCNQPNLIADCDLDGTAYGSSSKYCKKHTEKKLSNQQKIEEHYYSPPKISEYYYCRPRKMSFSKEDLLSFKERKKLEKKLEKQKLKEQNKWKKCRRD